MKRSTLFRPFLMLGVLLFAMLACMGSTGPAGAPAVDSTKAALEQAATAAAAQLTQIAQDSQAPQPTEQPAEGASATEAAPTASASEQYFTEPFETDSGQWHVVTVDASIRLTSPQSLPSVIQGQTDNVSVGVNDGFLVFDIGSKGLWVYDIYDPYEYDNVRVDVVAENRGTNDNNVSLICRFSQEDGWYEFNVANNGLYDILHGNFTKDGKVTYGKIADGGSNKIKQGKETNSYAISCKDRVLVLYINGYETRRLTDNQYVLRKGKVGISVSSFNTLPVKVAFDSVKISEP
ncbi:MAG TPA: hypothetical protein VMJ64_11655 [Anaerolineales bacterium]|nr:hypothetical protein [Anaerolineales bacterium]